MFPSFVEGFGLPVGEVSLTESRASPRTGRPLPEVGGRFAKYVSPEDIEGGARLVEDLLADPAALADLGEGNTRALSAADMERVCRRIL